jgi:hypothetical protein
MAANTSPIYSVEGDIQGGDILTIAAADYTGTSTNNVVVFTADEVNGGYVQRLRFKAMGTNSTATVARVYVNNGLGRLQTIIPAPGTPSATTSTTGGSLRHQAYYAKVVAQDQYNSFTAPSAESALVQIAGTVNGSITWTWTQSTGSTNYRLYVGPVPGGQVTYFSTTTNTFVQTTATGIRDNLALTGVNNNYFVGEVSLPITTGIQTAATADIDYPLNFALPPGHRILVGLGTNAGAGWQVTGIGGSY